uniref:Uncharacterized protein n=1 Tax=Nelumbo nucifera TaxID=4432 RepID=A0A822YE25_NELNU|nr:TPA_asm: hypothetical protein HUJ06_029196 [Nelumbo nucifera]
MATYKLLTVTIFLALIFVRIGAETEIKDEVVVSEASDSSLIKLKELKSRISVLESSIDEKSLELKGKDDTIAQMGKTIREKSDSIASLQIEIDALQRKGTADAEEQVVKAHARAGELEKQVDKLKKEVETQNTKKDALEARSSEAEKKMRELEAKLQNLQKINDGQKSRIRKTERALKAAEEEMMKAKLEATSKTKELLEVHGAWLPSWLATHLLHYQSFMEKEWNEHGRPAMDVATQKALEIKAQAEKWALPHIETVKTWWIPAFQDQWLSFTTYVEPHVQLITTKAAEVYETSKNSITPHVYRVQEFADPYIQFTRPYLDQVAIAARPHVDKARVALKPYTKKAVHAYGKFLKSSRIYHHQVQGYLQENFKKHELTRPLATERMVWFLASVLLALPIIVLFKWFSTFFCKKAKKPTRSAHSNHTRRRAKRGHPDKQHHTSI